jgi:flagellar hook protein FlgE
MSLFNTLNSGATGLGAAGLGLAVIGDNIANLNTTAYKRNRAAFADMLPSTIGTMAGPEAVGRGVRTAAMVTEFETGSLQRTGSALDVAIGGSGWFQINDGRQDLYTRDGSFLMDNDNYIVTSSGHRVQGYLAEDGEIGPIVGDLRIDPNRVPQRETSLIELSANLVDPSEPDALATNALQGFAGQLDGNTVSIGDVSTAADHGTSLTVYDSLGRAHDAVIVFEMVGQTGTVTDWEYSVIIDGGEVDTGGAMGTDGMAFEIQSGTLSFDEAQPPETRLTITENPAATGWNWPGATEFTPTVDLSSMTYAGGDEFSVRTIAQDGYGVGDLVRLNIDPQGRIFGQYTNGQEAVLGQFALATFQSESGLRRLGGNTFGASLESGEPAVSAAGTGTRGNITGYALEGSNVVLEDEFVNMIQVQRTYQANASVISTVDETLQALVNLV